MSEAGDYSPAPWAKDHSHVDARRAYTDKVVGRGSVTPASIGISAADIVPEKLVCGAENPFVIVCDVTGSMGEWPAVIFSKLPYLEHEGRAYLGQDMEISFAAVGDHTQGDRYPLQVRPFVKGADLKTQLEKLIHEKGGGGDMEESYELAAFYYANQCETPKAVRKPLMVIIGDEGVHSVLTENDASTFAKTAIKGRLTPVEIFAQLRQKFEVYIIRKPYGCSGNDSSPNNDRIQKQWESLLGSDHVISLPDPSRVVDVMFGILGEFTGQYDEFVKELKERQGKDKDGPEKIEVVLKSLRSIHDKKSLPKLPPPARAKSVTRKSIKGAPGLISLKDDE